MRKSFSIALCALLIALCSTGCSLRRKSMSGAAEADLLTSAEVAGFMGRRKPAEPFTANGSVTLRRNGEEISSRIVLYYAPDGGMVITVRPVVFFEALRIGITSEGFGIACRSLGSECLPAFGTLSERIYPVRLGQCA